MNFMGIGTMELMLILVIALVVLGPGRMMEVARTLGKVAREVSRFSASWSRFIWEEPDVNPSKQTSLPSLPQQEAESQPTEEPKAEEGISPFIKDPKEEQGP